MCCVVFGVVWGYVFVGVLCCFCCLLYVLFVAGFVYVFAWGRCSPSAVGLVVKYLVAIEMPRVRFPDGALSLSRTPTHTTTLFFASFDTPYTHIHHTNNEHHTTHARPIHTTTQRSIQTYTMRDNTHPHPHPHQPTPSRPRSNTTHTHSFHRPLDLTSSPHLTVSLSLHLVSPVVRLQRAYRDDDGIRSPRRVFVYRQHTPVRCEVRARDHR